MTRYGKIEHFACLLVVLLAMPTAAQIDPDPDGVGIYADLDATQATIQVDPLVEFTLHVIATNISEEDIVSWALRVTASPGLYVLGYEIPYDYQTRLHQTDGESNFFIVAGDLGDPNADPPEPPVPIGYGPQMHLLDIICLIGEFGPHYLYVGPWDVVPGGPPTPVYYSTRALLELLGEQPLFPSSGSSDAPVFVVNGAAPISAEAMTLGQVKALYR